MSLLLGLLQAGYARKQLNIIRIPPVSVENKSCKMIEQKASYTTEALGQARTNCCTREVEGEF